MKVVVITSYRQLHDTGHKIRIIAKLHKVVPVVHYFVLY